MVAAASVLVWAYLTLPCPLLFEMAMSQSGGSQIPPPPFIGPGEDRYPMGVDPRVEQYSTNCSGVSFEAKPAGDLTTAPETSFSRIRKRAFRRARRRAEMFGFTTYRGRTVSAKNLSTRVRNPAVEPLASLTAPRLQKASPQSRFSRLAIMTYNCSSMTAELYDVLCDWLQHRCTSDVVVLQETHWGLGKSDATWQIPGWSFVNTADPGNRYSGVAILVSHRVSTAANITFCSWIPGRILHVKCECAHATLDLIGVYQHVWQEGQRALTESKRETFWVTLGRLLGGIPQRSLLVLAGDFNGPAEHLSGHIGRGVLPNRRAADAELLQLLQTHRLVLLNTWGRVSSDRTATFVHDLVRTLITWLCDGRQLMCKRAWRDRATSTWRRGAWDRGIGRSWHPYHG